jgi:hypothetical protein
MTRIFKIRYTSCVRSRGSSPYKITFLGSSRLDGYPVFSIELPEGDTLNWEWFTQSFSVDGYSLEKDDIELMPSLEEVVKPMPFSFDEHGFKPTPLEPPSRTIFYMDYKYSDKPVQEEPFTDEALILMI